MKYPIQWKQYPVRYPEDLIKKVDRIVKRLKLPNRAEAMRQALQEWIKKYETNNLNLHG